VLDVLSHPTHFITLVGCFRKVVYQRLVQRSHNIDSLETVKIYRYANCAARVRFCNWFCKVE